MKKNIILALSAIATMHGVISAHQSTTQPQSWTESAINAVDTAARVTASTTAGMTTGIFSAYGIKAILKLLHMNNEFTPKTGAVFALLTLGIMSKEYSLRNGIMHDLTRDVSPAKKSLIKDVGNLGSWIGFLLVGLNPNSMFPGL